MTSKRQTIPYGVNQDSAPPSSGVVSERGSMRSTGTRRRRTSEVQEVMTPPRSPLPAPALPREMSGSDPASTAVTQPMPMLTDEELATAARPAIPPPSLAKSEPAPVSTGSRLVGGDPQTPAGAPRSDRTARRAKLETPGVYRFTSPESERRKKR
jgi:hypothetical protein